VTESPERMLLREAVDGEWISGADLMNRAEALFAQPEGQNNAAPQVSILDGQLPAAPAVSAPPSPSEKQGRFAGLISRLRDYPTFFLEGAAWMMSANTSKATNEAADAIEQLQRWLADTTDRLEVCGKMLNGVADVRDKLKLELAESVEAVRLLRIAAQHLEREYVKAAQFATPAMPAWVLDWTPEMMTACENYYTKWQRVEGYHSPDKVKADAWSAWHAWRAVFAAAPDKRNNP